MADARIYLSSQPLLPQMPAAKQPSRLGDAVNKMASKGARESLIYMNDVALVVSIRNRTVITAMDGMSAKDNIFTNIDSAAIL